MSTQDSYTSTPDHVRSPEGGADDLPVFVNESDATDWEDGTKVEMVVENVKVTIDGDTNDGWLRAKSVKTLS